MKKIPLIFLFNHDVHVRKMTENQNPACQWVFDGEGVATRKYDGTACAIIEGMPMKRRMVKPGKRPPEDFIPEETDVVTGKDFGWVQVQVNDKYHWEAYDRCLEDGIALPDGTYELIGPKVQGNPEKVTRHLLKKHSEAQRYFDVPRSYNDLKRWLSTKDIEGLVFHHIDGRMAKIRKKDFGLSRKVVDTQG